MTLDLARLEALEKAVTPKPWGAEEEAGVVYLLDATGAAIARTKVSANGPFIAAMRNALPELIAAAYGLEQAKREAAQWKTAYFGEKGSERHANVTERDELRARLAEAAQLLHEGTDPAVCSVDPLEQWRDYQQRVRAFLARSRETKPPAHADKHTPGCEWVHIEVGNCCEGNDRYLSRETESKRSAPTECGQEAQPDAVGTGSNPVVGSSSSSDAAHHGLDAMGHAKDVAAKVVQPCAECGGVGRVWHVGPGGHMKPCPSCTGRAKGP